MKMGYLRRKGDEGSTSQFNDVTAILEEEYFQTRYPKKRLRKNWLHALCFVLLFRTISLIPFNRNLIVWSTTCNAYKDRSNALLLSYPVSLDDSRHYFTL